MTHGRVSCPKKGGGPVDRESDLRSDYELLGSLLDNEDDGAKASALARERRMIGDLLQSLEAPKGVSVVDDLAARRRSPAEDPGAAPSRRRSRGG